MAFYKYYMGVNQHSKTREISNTSDVWQERAMTVMYSWGHRLTGNWHTETCLPSYFITESVAMVTGDSWKSIILTENITWRRAAPLDNPQTPSSSFHIICSATVLSFVEHIYIFILSLIYLCSAAQHPELLTVPPPPPPIHTHLPVPNRSQCIALEPTLIHIPFIKPFSAYSRTPCWTCCSGFGFILCINIILVLFFSTVLHFSSILELLRL